MEIGEGPFTCVCRGGAWLLPVRPEAGSAQAGTMPRDLAWTSSWPRPSARRALSCRLLGRTWIALPLVPHGTRLWSVAGAPGRALSPPRRTLGLLGPGLWPSAGFSRVALDSKARDRKSVDELRNLLSGRPFSPPLPPPLPPPHLVRTCSNGQVSRELLQGLPSRGLSDPCLLEVRVRGERARRAGLGLGASPLRLAEMGRASTSVAGPRVVAQTGN